MKYLASLLVGAAVVVVAMPAAASGNIINQGSIRVPGGPTSVSAVAADVTGMFNYALPANQSIKSAMLITSNGLAAKSTDGALKANAGATFTLRASVPTTCAYYTGVTDTNINLGDLGIFAGDYNAQYAFRINGGIPKTQILTNMAGCNTHNTVSLSKVNLTNAAAGGLGYDSNQFTNVIPMTAKANYVAGAVGSTLASAADHLTLGLYDTATATKPHGAWKSPMTIDLEFESPQKGLVAGDYEGSVTVDISVGI